MSDVKLCPMTNIGICQFQEIKLQRESCRLSFACHAVNIEKRLFPNLVYLMGLQRVCYVRYYIAL